MSDTGKNRFTAGEVCALPQMIEYGTEAVVSRALIQKDAGNVTLFAFDTNQAISEHTAPYDALVYVIEGSLIITIGGVPGKLAAGDVMVMPAGKPHALRAVERSKMLLVMIRQ